MQCWISKHSLTGYNSYKSALSLSLLTLTAMFVGLISLSGLCLVFSAPAPFKEGAETFTLGDVLSFRGSEEGGDEAPFLRSDMVDMFECGDSRNVWYDQEDGLLGERVEDGSSLLEERLVEDRDLLQDSSDDLEADRIMEEWNEQQDQVTDLEEMSRKISSL